jgi:DNA-binding MarR family transcriptional regulator
VSGTGSTVGHGSYISKLRSTPQDTGLKIKRLQARHHKAGNAALAELGVTIVQWDALRNLHRNPDASLHDLARLTFQTDQAFGTLAARLEARGLIERVAGPGRAVQHRLTDEGERVRAAGSKIIGSVIEKSFRALTAAQLRSLDSLLTTLLSDPVE